MVNYVIEDTRSVYRKAKNRRGTPDVTENRERKRAKVGTARKGKREKREEREKNRK